MFTADRDRAMQVARQLRSGTVGHNAFRSDFGIAFGGYKRSGIGREGGRLGLMPYLESQDRDPRRRADIGLRLNVGACMWGIA